MENYERFGEVIELPLSNIEVSDNSRADDTTNVGELMQSMKSVGLLQPLGVIKRGKTYVLAYGYRRLNAARKLGWTTIQCVIREEHQDADYEIYNLAENIQRANLSLTEVGRWIASLKNRGLKDPEIQVRLGVSKHYIKMAMSALSDVPKQYRDDVVFRVSGRTTEEANLGKITLRQAAAISSVVKSWSLSAPEKNALYETAKSEGAAFKPERVRDYALNLRQGLKWNDEVERTIVITGLIITDSERERLMAKYVHAPEAPYTSLKHVCAAILRGELSEKVNVQR